MPTLDDFFKESADILEHPRLREWKHQIDHGARLQLELHRPATSMGLSQAEMNVLRFDEGNWHLIDSVAWDEDLNAGLVQLGVRAADHSQEAERFALVLREALRKASREFGDGYFNAVLLAMINDSDLRQYPEIEAIFKHMHGNRPEQSKSYDLCREMIADSISARARELKHQLDYPETDAKAILVGAIARFLDQRFSVSSRRQMGLL